MKKLTVIFLSIFLLTSCNHNKGEQNVEIIDDVQNVIIKGYDAVAYFDEDQAVRGSKEFSTTHEKATYFFSSQKNLDSFQVNPEKFVPQYGGYCAFGVSVPNEKIDIEPSSFRLVEGKLYLNYSDPTQKIWLKNLEDNIVAGDENWLELKSQ
ncbi:MAG: YHS domain-containing protein [Lentimonas sp.]|jgi:YHS domain-containing protein